MGSPVLAVDIGATKAAIALVNENFEILEKYSIPTGNRSDIWNSISEQTRILTKNFKINIAGVGIGSAGPIDIKNGEISPVNIPSWRNFPIVNKFAEIYKTENIVLHGDAIALAHAEFKLGAGRDSENMLGMVVSTGIGGGLILNGKLFKGESGNAGYFGHHSISFESDICACGRVGCVELFASGPGMVKYALQLGWKNPIHTFESLSKDAISGDIAALKSLDRGTLALAHAITNVLCILDINLVVVGGGVIQAGPIYWDRLLSRMQSETRFAKFLSGVDLRKSQLNQDAGLIGAALGVMDK